jgi:beta-aspartyl-peptidase (threonine type)
MELLRAGASAMDAVEVAVRAAEANEADHYVGVGGLPNLLGEVELDASIMDGATRRAGAVAAVTGFPHPISIARAVCDRLPQHLLLVGAGAERFADEIGIERGQTLTDDARQLWQEGLELDALETVARTGDGELAYRRQAIDRLAAISHVTGRGELSTSWRLTALAVSPLASAPAATRGSTRQGRRLRADRRGELLRQPGWAAACTGRGELAIRANTAREVLLALQGGRGPLRRAWPRWPRRWSCPTNTARLCRRCA